MDVLVRSVLYHMHERREVHEGRCATFRDSIMFYKTLGEGRAVLILFKRREK